MVTLYGDSQLMRLRATKPFDISDDSITMPGINVKRLARRAAKFKTDCQQGTAIVMVGSDDLTLAAKTGMPLKKYTSRMRMRMGTLLSAVAKNHARVLILTPPPVALYAHLPSARASFDAHAEIILAWARKIENVEAYDIRDIFRDPSQKQGIDWSCFEEMCPGTGKVDLLHWSTKGINKTVDRIKSRLI